MTAKLPKQVQRLGRVDSCSWQTELVSADDHVVHVDMKVISARSLAEAIATLQTALQQRKEQRDLPLLEKQLCHIDAELGKCLDVAVPLSLEHLELYQQFLERVVVDGLPGATATTIARLLATVQKQLKEHPLAGSERSGDCPTSPGKGSDGFDTFFKVSMGRRRQMAVMIYTNFLTGPPLVFFVLFLLWLMVPYMTYVYLLYAAWQTYDNMRLSLPDPKRVSQALRNSSFYNHFRDYFPIRMVRETLDITPSAGKPGVAPPFDPKQHYLFCYHPHGVQSAGAFTFTNAATGFDKLFPGLSCSVQTLSMNFKLPFIRENILALGAGDASKESILKALKIAPGSSAMLVTGGAKESLFAHPFCSNVVLKERAGFVKVAINAGACLVPCWGFGENNLYENLAANSPKLRKWQRRVQKVISFAPLLVAGRGVFTYSAGLIPHRRPITVVVGEPIETGPADANPSNEKIQEIHLKYIQAVERIFNTYKEIYDPKAEPLHLM